MDSTAEAAIPCSGLASGATRTVWGAFCAGLLLLGLVLFVPVLQKLFLVVMPGGVCLWGMLLLAAAPTIVLQVGRLMRGR